MADFVEGLDVQVYTHRALADHQPIDQRLAGELLKWADGRPLVCTAKDYVRLPSFLAEKVWWRDVILEIANVPEAWLTPELMR